MDDIADRLGARSRCWDGGDSVPDAQLDADAAFEIRRLRSERDFLRRTLRTIIGTAASADNYQSPYARPALTGSSDPWGKYAEIMLDPATVLKDAPDDLAVFRGHKMTLRAWYALIRLGWVTPNQVIDGNINKLRAEPNVGRKTIGEIARLRQAIIERSAR